MAMYEPRPGKRPHLKLRLCEAQQHRCAVCTTPIKAIAYSSDKDRSGTVVIDRALPKTYSNSVALCALCAGEQAKYDSLWHFWEAFQAGTAFTRIKKKQIESEEVLAAIRACLDREFPEFSIPIPIPRGFRFAPIEKVEKIAASLILTHQRKAQAHGKKWKGRRSQKRRLLERQNHRCCYCGIHLTVDDPEQSTYATWEHVHDLRFGGANSIHNLAMACMTCNSLRNSLNLTAYEYTEWVVNNREELERHRRPWSVAYTRNQRPSRGKARTPPKPLYDYS